ncbi:hypothetical protein C9980_19430 [Vibrio mediterranei]|uniref:LacI family DNA-binding transcriptional regulator n=1 Tax=Vibrio mediterranei TaxID=689 RepID=UPI000D18678B|nr:LacI family DNA-binding transcriptional regulator [Vibrio mediterranei]PTC03186.1 hypothetical protein C9980_19430 [Vibrio mediterranei]
MATIIDVSRLANVSRATVTRVLNEPGKVKEATRIRVESAIKELNYVPSFSARSLVSKNSGIIGLLLPDNKSGFFGSVMSAIHKKVNSSGKMLMVLEAQGLEEECRALKSLSEINCDGFILYSRNLTVDTIIPYTKNKPVVVIDRKDIEGTSVYFDHFKAGFELAQIMIDAGHEHIAVVAGPKERKNSLERLNGCREAIEVAGLNLPDSMIAQGSYDNRFGMEATNIIMKNNPNTTAIVYCGERACAGGLKSLRMLGIQIPEQVSVASFDSYNLTEFLVPHVESIVYPVTEMAELAADKVISQLSNSATEIQSEQVNFYFNHGDSIRDNH